MSTKKKDIYKQVSEKFAEMMENGVDPWQKPWVGGVDRAYNNTYNTDYNLLNNLLLSRGGAWDSLKNWNKQGGRVRKGEKGEWIIGSWNKVYDKETKSEVKDRVIRTEVLKRAGYLSKSEVEYENKLYSTSCGKKWELVFHISQIDGEAEPKREVKELKVLKGKTKSVKAEKVLKEYIQREGVGYTEIEGGNEAYYMPSTDEITLPSRTQFVTITEFYSTAFHEVTHSTGSAGRLDRDLINRFGTEKYAKEELVAEMGSAYILHNLGIATNGTSKNSVAYLTCWAKKIRDDSKFFWTACASAEKACRFVLG